MDDDLELTPEALDAWGRAMAEIERRSKVCSVSPPPGYWRRASSHSR
jgi:hypothetical protein